MSNYEIKRAKGRTAVFSGTKQSSTQILTLKELCIEKLYNHVSLIEEVGDVKYKYIKPLLVRIPVDQLRRLEHFNPKFVHAKGHDELWRVHCNIKYPNCKPRRGQTWRELFHQREHEKEERLEGVKLRISENKKQASSVRSARIVDEILPGGKRHGISSKTVITRTIKNRIPSNGTANANGRPSTSGNNGSHIVTRIEIRRDASGATISKKPKTAPLMQKSLQLLKSRFKR